MFFKQRKPDATSEDEQARRNAALLDALHSTASIVEFAPDGRIISANDNFHRMLNYPLGSLSNKSYQQICADEYSQRLVGEHVNRAQVATSVCSFTPQSSELSEATKTKPLWIRMNYAPVKNNGQVISILATAAEITELQNAQIRSKEIQRALDSSMAVIEFDRTGIIITANNNFLAATGYALDEIKGKHHRMFCEDDYANSKEYGDLWQRLASGQFISSQFKRLKKDGSVLWLEASYTPLISDDGSVYGVMKFATDVTESVNQSKTKAERATSAYHITSETERTAESGTSIIQEAAREMA